MVEIRKELRDKRPRSSQPYPLPLAPRFPRKIWIVTNRQTGSKSWRDASPPTPTERERSEEEDDREPERETKDQKKMKTTAGHSPLLYFCFIILVFEGLTVAEVLGVAPMAPVSLPAPAMGRSSLSPFRPSIVVIIGILTTIFSVTFLILLYAKHCKRTMGGAGIPVYGQGAPPSSLRRNSGVDRKIIESLPVFRFASLRGPKDGLECAVCLNPFELVEILRLLPKCKHAFHVECVDTWLESHSTCPLCRFRVDPEDILLVIEEAFEPAPPPSSPPPPAKQVDEIPPVAAPARVSGRHSSAGEKSTRPPIIPTAVSSRVSADAAVSRKGVAVTVRSVGCFDRPRKDKLLLPDMVISDRESFERRLSHRIVVSDSPALEQRSSDIKPSDLLFLRSEMIMMDSGRYSMGPSDPTRRSVVSVVPEEQPLPETRLDVVPAERASVLDRTDSTPVLIRTPNPRSVSEITSLARFRKQPLETNKWQNRFSVS